MKAAIGIRTRTGPATLIAVGGDRAAPVVLERAQLWLLDSDEPSEPYHVASRYPHAEAEAIVENAMRAAAQLAERAIAEVLSHLRADGHDVAAAGVVLGNSPAPTLERALRVHVSMHHAEGELFREAVGAGAEACGLPVTGAPEREIAGHLGAIVGASADAMLARVTELGAAIGPPWRREEKYASLAAWLALATA